MMEEALMMATPAAPNTPRRSQRLAQGTQNTMDENIENADNDVFVTTIYHTISSYFCWQWYVCDNVSCIFFYADAYTWYDGS